MIEIENLTRTFLRKSFFTKHDPVIALREVNLSIEEGCLAILVGPNGSGKTTLLKVIAGILLPSSGSVKIKGVTPESACQGGWIGFLSGSSKGLYGRLSGWENLLFFGKLSGLEGAEIRRRVKGFQAVIDPGDFLKFRVQELSEGLKARLRLISALLPNPPVLLLDEPFQDLDVETLEKMKTWLAEETAEKRRKTILMTSHRAEEFSGLNGGIISLKEGRVNSIS